MYDDAYDRAVSSLIEPKHSIDTQLLLIPSFLLDDGEDAAVTLAGSLDAVLFLCDKLNQLGLIHVLFGDMRLVTASTLRLMLVRTEQLSTVDTYPLLNTISVNHLACGFSLGFGAVQRTEFSIII